MATKNLARTVIEGGRTGYYKSSVETLTSEERAATKEFLRAVRNDPERADEIVNPVRKPVSVSFADKLRPMYRFMDSKLGQNWSKVRSELFRKFDTRTTPGRHVLFDHLLRDVVEGPLPEKGTTSLFRFFTYYLDRQGRLCKNPESRRQRYRLPEAPCDYQELVEFLGNRKVGQMGERLVWFLPTRDADNIRAVWDRREHLVYAVLDAKGNPIRDLIVYPGGMRYYTSPKDQLRPTTVPYRQGRLLDEADEKYVRGLPQRIQDVVFAKAPSNVGADGKKIVPKRKGFPYY